MTQELNLSKDLYTSIHKCIRCGQCTYGKDEAEYTRLCPLSKQGDFFSYSAGGLMQIARSMFEGKLGFEESIKDILFKCTTCGLCNVNCGVINDHQEIMSKMRKGFLENTPDSLTFLKTVISNIIEKKNPYGKENSKRDEHKEENENIFYFTGCVSAFDQKSIPKAFTGILKKTNTKYRTSNNEWCCGLPLYYNGYEREAKKLAQHNINLILESNIDTIVFSCPTCMLAFKKYYPAWLNKKLPFKIIHTTQYLNNMLKKGKLKINNKEAKQEEMIYHDSCHLGRELRIFDEPRALLEAFNGKKANEFDFRGENNACCGGGGMVPVTSPSFSYSISTDRINQFDDKKIKTLVSACPNCKKTLNLGIKKMKKKITVKDVTEIVFDAIQ